MELLPSKLELIGVPAHVQSWSVAKVPGFVLAILSRWQRAHGGIPDHFFLTMCPQAEINARGGLPLQVIELTDPKLTCRHFTGCSKPYFAVIFAGESAGVRQREVQALLPWSETYETEITPAEVRLTFVGATEDMEDDETGKRPGRTLQELLESGELIRILE